MNKGAINLLGIESFDEPNGGFMVRASQPTLADAAAHLQQGDFSFIVNLLNKGMHPDEITTQDTKTPALSVAISNKDQTFVKTLLQYKANPNADRPYSYLWQTLKAIFDECNSQIEAYDSFIDGSELYASKWDLIREDLQRKLRPLYSIMLHLVNAGADPNCACYLSQEHPLTYPLHELIKAIDDNTAEIFLPALRILAASPAPLRTDLLDSSNSSPADLAKAKSPETQKKIAEALRPLPLS